MLQDLQLALAMSPPSCVRVSWLATPMLLERQPVPATSQPFCDRVSSPVKQMFRGWRWAMESGFVPQPGKRPQK